MPTATPIPAHRLTDQVIRSEAELRALIGEPLPLTPRKISDRLNARTRLFVARAPFVCLATADAARHCDVSPRGDPAGFVRILDERTLLLPDRPGNRLADSLRNILANPRVGLLFLVSGIGDSFRVNGRATLTTDAALLAPSTVEGNPPKLGILVDIEEAYTQCSKTLLRSRLWDPALHVDPAAMPTTGQVMRAVLGEAGEDFDDANYDRERAERYRQRTGFY